MRFPQAEVLRLLAEHFDRIEQIWDQEPYDAVNAYALTIKEFMRDHAISAAEEGIARFVDFKRKQTQCLSEVGLTATARLSLPFSKLATQPV